jgi:hypothetical protein
MEFPRASVPTSLAHLALIRAGAEAARARSLEAAPQFRVQLEMIGTGLKVFYEAATCNRRCHGGEHVLESICGRLYNLGAAAYSLALAGYYDEALNLVRSLGEIANIVSLSTSDGTFVQQWLGADARTRKRDFAPGRIRGRLKAVGGILIATDDWYAEFCESFTHPTPGTRPNVHNDAGMARAGGVFQPAGLERVLNELGTMIGAVAMIIGKYFDFDDSLQEIFGLVDRLSPDESKPAKAVKERLPR